MRNSIQLRRIKYTCLGLIVNLLTSERFIGQVYEVIDSNSEEELNKIKELYQRLLEETLEYLKFVCHQMKSQKESQNERYWAAMERKLADLVDAVNSILPPELLVDVVSKLLNTKSDMIRCRAMEILASKLQPDIKFFKDEFVDNLLGFIDPLLKIAVNNKEQEESRQIALFTLQLLVRRMYLVDDLTVFSPILASSTSLLKEKDLSVKVLTQATLVIAELIHAMKKFSLIYLNEVFPSLLSILENSLKDELQNLDNLQIAAATALLRVVENVPRLLPRNYMETLLIIICQLMSKEENEDGQKESKLANKLSSILDLLLQNVESRILLPCLSKTFDVLCSKDVFSLPSLMKFIEVMIGFLKPSEITLYKKHLNQLFTNALDVRTSKLSLDEKTLNHVESCVISAVIRFLLKLNGEDNVAFIKMLMEWAWSNIQQKPSRLTTFFRFSSRLANGLKVLFIKTNIAILIHPKAAEVLDQNNNLLTNKTVFGKGTEAESKASELIQYVLETLSNIYLYDTVSFTNEDRFTEIVKSLTNQIENTIGTEENHKARISDHLKTCIIRLTKALTDDSLWKELNSQILSKIRTDNDSKVILSGLEIFEGIVEALGEDYLQPLLADTIPSIIEVLESLDVDVEMKTKEIFYKMEAILGDSLRAYLET
ncbi:HEAT repeat-containing protein 1 [Armadillidium vulgare]|nr:HEAT repeat-containing protein 1 [Armadillidium vulgare]